MARGDPEKHFLDYGYIKQNSKILYSYHKKRIPSSFSETFFIRYKLQFESRGLQTTYSNMFYFLSYTIDRSKKINRHLGYVSLSLIDMPENTFETKENVPFDTSKLDFACPENEVMSGAAAKILKIYSICRVPIWLRMQMDSYLRKVSMSV